MSANFWILGVNFKTTAVSSRERWSLEGPARAAFLEQLKKEGLLSESVFVATCNRVELYGVSSENGFDENRILDLWGISEKPGYVYKGREALQHLFRVVTSLDAMVIGEPQVLGQVKEAYTQSVQDGTIGVCLHQTFQQAFAVAKRVREKTGIGKHPVSVASIAIRLAEELFSSFKNLRVLVVGKGEMGGEIALLLKKKGVSEVVTANRSVLWKNYLEKVDIAIFATSSHDILLKAGEVKSLLSERQERPLFLMDLCSPRNVDPALGQKKAVFLYNIDDLERLAETNRQARSEEAQKAEEMISLLVEEAFQTLRPSQVEEMIASLHVKWEEIRKLELEKTFSRHPSLPQEQREAMDVMTRAMVKKMLKDPIVSLKALQEEQENPSGILHFLRRLFALESA